LSHPRKRAHSIAVSIRIFLFTLCFFVFFFRPPRRLFEEHQELLQLFTKFGELKTRDAQANSMELAEHANKVMTTLDEGIKELDDLDNFFQYLTQVGATHKTIPGFDPEYFWVSSHAVRTYACEGIPC
jgi:hypothetical protein